MAYSSVPVTPGSGAPIAVDQVNGLEIQVAKLDFGSTGQSSPAQADGSGNLKINIAAATGTVTIQPAASQQFPIVNVPATTISVSAATALPVSALNTAPVSVRLSNGAGNVDTIPVTGTVTSNQGTAASNSSAWPVKISDGTNSAPLDGSNGNALKVSLVATAAAATTALADKGSFTEGTTLATPIAGEYNTSTSSPSSGQSAAVRITASRALMVNLQDSSGAELGTSANPLRIDPKGTTTQPVSVSQVGGSSVATVASGVQKVALGDSSTGAGISQSNPLPVTPAPNPGTFWSNHVAYTASQSNQTIQAPGSGKTLYVQGLIITPNAAGTLEIFDQTAGATADLFNGTLGTSGVTPIKFSPPRPLSAINNNLKYTSGSGAAGDVVAWGYYA